jgi:hypothetical protein
MSKAKVRFVGRPGSYISGIPARDLTDAEWDKLTPKQQEFAVSSGLYKKSAGRSGPDKDKSAPEKVEGDA